MSLLRERNPPLAAALDSGDLDEFRKVCFITHYTPRAIHVYKLFNAFYLLLQFYNSKNRIAPVDVAERLTM